MCLLLAGAAPALAQNQPGSTTIMLPNNLARDGDLANEAFRHDGAVAHIHDNMRNAEYAHKHRIEDIQKNDRISGEQKAKLIADENQQFQNEMRALQRGLSIAEQEHAQKEAQIRARYPEPGDKMEIGADSFNAEGSMLDRARAVANEDIRYDGAVAHVDENRRARQVSHSERMKAIDQDKQPEDAKELERAQENERLDVDMRNLDRMRKLVDEEHENRRAAIDARFGNPNPGGDIFASQSDPQNDQTPPQNPGPAQDDNAPLGGGVSTSQQGGGAIPGTGARPPIRGGVDQKGTGGVGRQPPASRPPVLQGRVEENVNQPPVKETQAQQPCSKEWAFGTPDPEQQFTEGLTAGVAHCVELDWAMMPVAGPLAYAASKARMVAMIVTAATRVQGAAALYRDLQKQRAAGECGYDTGLWYAQVLCDAHMMAAKGPDSPSAPGNRGGLDPVRPVRPPLKTGEDPAPAPRPAPEPAQQQAQQTPTPAPPPPTPATQQRQRGGVEQQAQDQRSPPPTPQQQRAQQEQQRQQDRDATAAERQQQADARQRQRNQEQQQRQQQQQARDQAARDQRSREQQQADARSEQQRQEMEEQAAAKDSAEAQRAQEQRRLQGRAEAERRAQQQQQQRPPQRQASAQDTSSPPSLRGRDLYQERGETVPELDPSTNFCGPAKTDCFWRAMRNATGDPAFEKKFDGPGVTTAEFEGVLKQYFAGKVPGANSQAHADGVPVRMSFDEIVDHLKDKEGAEGIVFIKYQSGGGHVVNVANFKRFVVFIDDQKQFWPGDSPRQTVERAVRGKVAYTMFYRTK
jgi:hypothetical protein